MKNNTPKVFCSCIILVLCTSLSVNAQFFLNGSARSLNDSCYQLTPASNNRIGSIWNGTKINLNESFEVVLEMFFGCKDTDGADGIVFGFQPVSTSLGSPGEGIGFSGISPSLGIEIDTWQNFNLADPSQDHIAVIRNGNLNHGFSNTLAGPVTASATQVNIEDCSYHDVRVSWDAEAMLLSIFFDCELRLTYQGNIVRDIFNGDPFVFWGFTSATGGANNVHEVCFSYTTFLSELEDVVVCPGGQAQLRAFGGDTYVWTPATGLNNPTIANPIVRPEETTLYTVEIRKGCVISVVDTVLVEVVGDTITFDLGRDTSICEGDQYFLDATTPGSSYRWSTGATEARILPDDAGLYRVTVTQEEFGCQTFDDVRIDYTFLPEVFIGNDTLLCLGQELFLEPFIDGPEWMWSTGDQTESLLINKEGRYNLTVTNKCGTRSDMLQVRYDNCRDLYIPNAFSPNRDGINDVFTFFDNGDVQNIEFLRIFDRWGSLVFERTDFMPNDQLLGWDGEVNGEDAPQGVYIYVTDVVFRDGRPGSFSGEVHLIR